MSGQILDYFAKIHETHIHARGKVASAKLIELLDCEPGETILELGFGSGATLAYLASVFRKTNFQGLEASEVMHRIAGKRLRFCGLSKSITLHLLKKGQKSSLSDSSFDKVFAESVIAIQDGDGVKEMLLEIQRILKPDGVLVFNETIWLDSVHRDEVETINQACLKSFGIIQSNSKVTHLKDWTNLLTELGFEVEIVLTTDELTDHATFRFNLPTLLSNSYTLLGKMKRMCASALRSEWKTYQGEMKAIMPPDRKMMEGVILKASNKKYLSATAPK